MSKFSIIKEIFALFIHKRKFHMFSIIVLLIAEFYKITGIPVLINTSMNVRGEPIVNTPEQAYNMITKTDMDYIVMGNYIVKKQ